VLDNTYPSRKSRNEVIECAWSHGVPARCVWVATTIADARVNAIPRMLDVHGSLPNPEDIRERGKEDPRFFGPEAQFRYERTVEPPSTGEGFTRVEERVFERRPAPNAQARLAAFDVDDLLAVDADTRHAAFARLRGDGWLLFAHAWRPKAVRGSGSIEDVVAEMARVRGDLGLDHVAVCPHDAGPPVCWCRKPIPGSLLEFARGRGAALGRSVVVGRCAADRTMAERLGMTFRETDAFLSA